jgi:cation transport regulator
MPYADNQSLPKQVRASLPQHAQTIYREAFNSAWDHYADPDRRADDASREATAHRVAWSAVKTRYQQGDSRWRRKPGK